jgi:NADH pyrophosphatase NudC (nudix superfamily)
MNTINDMWCHCRDYLEYDSDDSVYEDLQPARSKAKGSAASSAIKAARTKECPACGARAAVAAKQCKSCDHRFMPKSSLQSVSVVSEKETETGSVDDLDEYFPFEPERV